MEQFSAFQMEWKVFGLQPARCMRISRIVRPCVTCRQNRAQMK
jgi:hypothetical protein